MIDDVAHIAAMRRLQDVMVGIAAPPKGWTAVHSASLELALSNGDTATVCRLTDKLESSAQPYLVQVFQMLRNLSRRQKSVSPTTFR